ncbi:MAG: hypothetical protein RLZZ473_654 [Pseudomonadota bacterium]|jgi:hypothetical protein
MHSSLVTIFGLAVLSCFVGCGGSGGGDTPRPPPIPTVEQTFDFAQGNGGWLTDIADYSPATAPSDVITEIRTLPAPLSGSGYYFYGTNRSDDLFIYGKTKVTGLANSVTYRVFVDVEFATDVPSGCVGVGGSPGESVWIVAAASPGEPLTIFNGSDYRVNIDRGNQSQGGARGLVLGNIANSVAACGTRRWETKTVVTPTSSTLSVTSDERGAIWLLVGMDSGFESLSRIYLRRVIVRLVPTV